MKCIVESCEHVARERCWDGKHYCSKHYYEQFTNELESEWSSWVEGAKPPERLLYLLGRCIDEKLFSVRNGLMTAARLRDRGFNFQKEADTFTFEITRHPGAWTDNNPALAIKRVVQRWSGSVRDRYVEFVVERSWTKDDPDL